MTTHNHLTVAGYACYFNQVDQNNDIIKSTAFDSVLQPSFKTNQIKFLYQHDVTRPIGVWTLIQPDQTGLYVEGILFEELPDGFSASIMTKNKIINGLSIGYKVNQAEQNQDHHRILSDVTLFEISLVTFPMQVNAHLWDMSDPIQL